jgi:hypothetical protein
VRPPSSLFEHHPSRFLVTTQLAFGALPHLTPSVGLFFSYVIMSALQYFDQGLSTPLGNPLSDITSLFKLFRSITPDQWVAIEFFVTIRTWIKEARDLLLEPAVSSNRLPNPGFLSLATTCGFIGRAIVYRFPSSSRRCRLQSHLSVNRGTCRSGPCSEGLELLDLA